MRQKLMYLGLIMVLMTGISSCTKNAKVAKLLKHIPDNCDVVMAGDLETVVKSLGGEIKDERIKLPSSVTSIPELNIEKGIEEINDKVKEMGINPEACAIAGGFEGDHFILAMIDDEKKFKNYIDSEGYDLEREEDGVTYYLSEPGKEKIGPMQVAALKGKFVYISSEYGVEGKEAVKNLKKKVEAAKDGPMSKTAAGKYLCEGNVGGIFVKIPKETYSELTAMGISSSLTRAFGSVAMNIDMQGEDATVRFKIFDSSGDKIDPKDLEDVAEMVDLETKINPEALKYFGKTNNFVYAFALKELNIEKIMKGAEGPQITILKNYLGKLEGTIAVGIGVKDGLDGMARLSMLKDSSALDMTLVAQTKKGEAESIVSDLKVLMKSQEVPVEEYGSGLKVEIDGISIYVESKGDFIVMSTQRISDDGGSPAVEALKFEDEIMALAISYPTSDALVKDLGVSRGISASLTFDYKKMEGTLHFTIDGSKGEGFLAEMIQIVKDCMSNQKTIEAKLEKLYKEKYGDQLSDKIFGMDTAELEEEAVVEEEIIASADTAAY